MSFEVTLGTLRPSWALHGADVDLDFANQRYYGDALHKLITVARASVGYATNADGTVTRFANNLLRIGVRTGLLIEESRTNVVLWCRDRTNVAWTNTNVTAAKDQVGVDGVANAASSLTATGANGTSMQAITLASTARWQSAYIKRITGSGNIDMTMDGGTTWTTISGSINSNTYTRVSIPTQTLANPNVGLRLVTSGDKIAVDFAQNENGAFITSPIETTTAAATRPGDNVTFLGMARSILSGVNPRFSMVFKSSGVTPVNTRLLGPQAQANTAFTLTTVQLFDNVFGGAMAVNNLTLTSPFAFGLSNSSLGRTAVGLPNSGGTPTSTGSTIGTWTNPQLGGTGAAGEYANGYYTRLAIWSTKIADARLLAMTQKLL